jgi:excisionase family DNA binding protein
MVDAGRPLDVTAAAAYLGVKPRYIRHLVHERRIAYYKVGRLLRFEQRDLDHFLATGRIAPARSERDRA